MSKRLKKKPKIKSATDRPSLDRIRNQIGSNFNLIASQFEEVEIIIFTENKLDFYIISSLAKGFGFTRRTFNIPLHGFSEYKKSVPFSEAYQQFFGKRIAYTVVLDQDYYPQEFLATVKDELARQAIKVVFTPGKEIENIFLDSEFLTRLLPGNQPTQSSGELLDIIDKLFQSEYEDCFASYLELHQQYKNCIEPKLAQKTLYKLCKERFDTVWNNPSENLRMLPGKKALAKLRVFFREKYKIHLSTMLLTERLIASPRNTAAKQFIKEIYYGP